MHGFQIPLDAADGQPPFFPHRGDAADQVDAQALPPQCHAVQFRGRHSVPLTHWAGPGDEDMLDDLPGALDSATSQVSPAIRAVLHHVLHPVGRCHTRAGEAVASRLSGLLLRWQLATRTGLEAGHTGRAARFRLPLQFGNPPLQPLNHPLLFQNGGLQLGDDGDEDSAVGGGQVSLSIHALYMTSSPPPHACVRQPSSGQFTSPNLKCYGVVSLVVYRQTCRKTSCNSLYLWIIRSITY